MSAHQPGRLRRAAVDLLRAAGYALEPGDVWTAEGAERRSSAGPARWGFEHAEGGRMVPVYCYDTLSDFVRKARRYGIDHRDDAAIGTREVWGKDNAPAR